jgi:hypothetical protein
VVEQIVAGVDFAGFGIDDKRRRILPDRELPSLFAIRLALNPMTLLLTDSSPGRREPLTDLFRRVRSLDPSAIQASDEPDLP